VNDLSPDRTTPNAHPSATRIPTSVAAALAMLDTWSDLSTDRRAALRDALLTVTRITGLPAEAIPLECEFLSRRLVGHQARNYGVGRKRHANVVSNLRFVLRRLGIDRTVPATSVVLSPAWAALREATPAGVPRYRLSRFYAYCSRQDIAPEAVDETTLEAFVDELLGSAIVSRPQYLGRRTVTAWNAQAKVSSDVLRSLSWRRGRQRYTLPLDAFPASFQVDVEQFRTSMSDCDPAALFDDLVEPDPDRTARHYRPLRASTVSLRIEQILLAAAALVHSGRDPATITTLRDLVEPYETVRTIIAFFWERGDRQAGSFVGGIAEALRQIAKYHHPVADRTLIRITRLRERVTPMQHGMCPRVRERLRQLTEPQTRAMLLHLPDELLRRATGLGDDEEARRMVQCAVALQILMVCPLRISNLVGLRLDRHLRRELTGKRRITHIVLAPEEVKNAEAIEWPLSPRTAHLVDYWIKSYRPANGTGEPVWLFPGMAGRSAAVNTMRRILVGEVKRMIGVRIHPHLLRHFAAWLFLKHNPGAYEAVRRILGHRSLTTTLAAYTGMEANAAAERLDKIISEEVTQSRLIAAQAYKTRRAKPRPDRDGR